MVPMLLWLLEVCGAACVSLSWPAEMPRCHLPRESSAGCRGSESASPRACCARTAALVSDKSGVFHIKERKGFLELSSPFRSLQIADLLARTRWL